MILKPVYGFNALIRVPNYNSVFQNTCVEVLKSDIGQNGLSKVSLVRGTAILKLEFTGASPEGVTKEAKAYLPGTLAKIDKMLNEPSVYAVSSNPGETSSILKAELSAPDTASNVPIAPNKKKNLGLAFAAGLFLSCGWVVARYVFRKSREGK